MLHVSLHITNNFVEVLIFTYLFKCLISFFHVAFYEFESKLCLVVAVITADGNPLTTHLQYLCYESYKYYKNKELVGNKWVKQFSYLQPSKPKQPCAFKFVYIAKCKCILYFVWNNYFRARGKCRSRPKTYFFTCGKQCKNKYGIFSGWNEKKLPFITAAWNFLCDHRKVFIGNVDEQIHRIKWHDTVYSDIDIHRGWLEMIFSLAEYIILRRWQKR